MKTTLLICALIAVSIHAGCWDKGGDGEKPTPTPTATQTPKPVPTPAEACKPFEKPCEGRGPVVSHAYSECCADGFWHVVQDDYYFCPELLKKFRVAPDTPTLQRCKEGAGAVVPAPNPVGIGYKDFHNDTTCQSPKPLARKVTISVCENGVWVNKTYKLYECLDKTLRITEPPDSLTKTEVKCTDPPPPPPAQ
jgi:hypothetical protein